MRHINAHRQDIQTNKNTHIIYIQTHIHLRTATQTCTLLMHIKEKYGTRMEGVGDESVEGTGEWRRGIKGKWRTGGWEMSVLRNRNEGGEIK